MRILSLVLLLATLASAQSSHDGKMISDIRFRGLVELSPEYLKRKIKTRVGDAYDSLLISQDIRRLYELGDFLGDIRVYVDESSAGVVVTFEVEERRICLSVTLVGHDELYGLLPEHPDKETVQDFMHLRSGDLYNHYYTDLDKNFIEKTYRDAGYLFAAVDIELEEVPGGVNLTYVVHEGPRVYVEAIEFLGNANLPGEDLLARMKTKERSWPWGLVYDGVYNPSDFEDDVLNLERYCRSQGFLNARVWLGEMVFSEDKEWLTLKVRVEEGTRFRVERIDIAGATLYSADYLRSRMQQKIGEPFDGETTNEDIQTIRALYSQKAHLFAKVRLEIAYTDSEDGCVVSLTLDEGEPITIERVSIFGNDKTRDRVIRRQLAILPGHLYDSERMKASVSNLGRLGYFTGIETDFREGSAPDKRELILELEEGETGHIGLGGGYSSAFGFTGVITLVQQNFDITRVPESWGDIIEGRAFAGAGQSFKVELRPGNRLSSYQVSFTEPYLFGTHFSLSTNAFVYQRIYRDYTDSRLGLGLGFGRHLDSHTEVSLGYRLEEIYIGNVDSDAVADVIEVSGGSALSMLRFGVTLDHRVFGRDLLIDSGWQIKTMYEIAGSYLGGDWDFHRMTATGDHYWTMFRWPFEYPHIFHIQAQFGWSDAYGRRDEIPIFERFYAGGPQTIRGFEYRSVGPQEDDRPVGGEALLWASAEYSFPMYQNVLRGVFFVDAGSVEPEWRSFDLDRVRLSVGWGLRLRVPVFPAPLSLDFGFPLLMEDTDDREYFHLNFGFGI